MSFNIPAFDDVDESGVNIPDEGWHDLTLTKREAKQSSAGNDMMVTEFVIDSGPGAGHTITEYVVFGTRSLMGEAKLKKMCKAAGFKWEQKPDLDAFVAQFPVDKLRIGALLTHSYSVQRNDRWEDCEKDLFDSWEGKKFVKAVFAGDFRPPSSEREVLVADEVTTNGAAATDDPPF